jgi:hypothetical protein
VSGVTFAIPARKIGGDLDILFSVLDIDLTMSRISRLLNRYLRIKPVGFGSRVFLLHEWIQDSVTRPFFVEYYLLSDISCVPHIHIYVLSIPRFEYSLKSLVQTIVAFPQNP